MIGRRLDRYELLSSLGQGGMGTVWRARDTHLERDVALKIVAPHLAGSSDARARLLREAKTASKLEHPGIARVLDAGEADGDLYVVFELIEGSTLKDHCTASPVKIEDAVRWIREAAEALAYAHDHGILHRDVTSRNVMVDRDGRAVLVDFGLATTEEGSRWTQATAPLGTASYIAPEVARGERADRRSDVYSLCVVLYELLTGRPPFSGERLEAVLYAVVHEEAPLPSTQRQEIPAWLDEVLAQGLAKDPNERIPAAEDLLTRLMQTDTASGHGLRRSPGRTGDRSKRRLFRSRSRTVGLGATIVLMVTLIAVSPLRHRFIGTESSPGFGNIAVVTLDPRSEDGPVGIAEGVWASVQSKLARFSTLSVVPWETSRRIGVAGTEIQDIARQLRADALILGQMVETNERIRGTVSILRGEDSTPLWYLEFDEPAAQVVELEQRIATQVAEQLIGRLSRQQREGLERKVTTNPEAFELYLEGARELQTETREGARRAEDLFMRALDLDPDFALAHVGLGASHSQGYWFSWEGGTENLSRARRRFQRALELDPELLEARRGLITVEWYELKSERCLQQGELVAATGRTDVDALVVQGIAYMLGGLASRAQPFLERVLELDPNNESAMWWLPLAAVWARNWRQVVEYGSKYMDTFGEHPEIRMHMGIAYEELGRSRIAAAMYERARTLYADNPNLSLFYTRPLLYERTGDVEQLQASIDDAKNYLNRQIRVFEENAQLYASLALLHAIEGDATGAENYLARTDESAIAGLYEIVHTLVRLGREEEARDKLRSFWNRGYFSELDLTHMMKENVQYEPALGPLLPEAEAIRQRLLARYDFGFEEEKAKDGSVP